MKNIHKIMFDELRPWSENYAQVDEYYKPLTRSVKSVQTGFSPNYELSSLGNFLSKHSISKS